MLSRALAFLSRRDSSRTQFIQKMIAGGYEKSEVEAAADWCQQQGFLDEGRYVEGAARRLSAKYGTSRVLHTLRQKGATEESIAEVTSDLKENELAQARAVWVRKFREPPADANAKSKQIRYLQTRGFSFDIIKRVITGVEDE
ncbi:MAG: recombination regulator RecX [Betaproteobacteria bacterium]